MTMGFVALLAAALGAVTVALTAGRVLEGLTASPSQALADYMGASPPPSPVERVGRSVGRLSPSLLQRAVMAHHRRWLELEGGAPSPAYILGAGAIFAAGGLLIFAFTGAPLALALMPLGAFYPFVRLRSRANRIRRAVSRALPDLAALLAAELAAGNAPDRALQRAAEWGGPLAELIRQAVRRSQVTGLPLFSRGRQDGALVRIVEGYDLPALQAFIRQIDLAARTGAVGPTQMQQLARSLIVEYKEQALREAEQLDGRLAVPAVLFFFMPFLFLLLAPLVYPLLEVL